MDTSWWIAEFTTGEYLAEVFPSRGPATRRIGEAPINTTDFNLNAAILTAYGRTPAFDLGLATPNALQVVCKSGSGVAYAGLIVRSEEDLLTGDVTLTHADIRKVILPRRSTMGSDGYSLINYQDVWGDFSVSTLIKIETRLLIEGPTLGYTFPFDWVLVDPHTAPPDGTNKIELYDYNLPPIDRVLEDLEKRGVEVDYYAHDVAGQIRWQQRVADTDLLTGGDPLEFNLSAPDHGVQKLVRILDGANQATNVTVTGIGSGLDRKFAYSRVDPPAGFPALEAYLTFPDEADQATLDGNALKHREKNALPQEQWDCTVLAEHVDLAYLNEHMGLPIFFFRQGAWVEFRVVGYTIDPNSDLVPLEIQKVS